MGYSAILHRWSRAVRIFRSQCDLKFRSLNSSAAIEGFSSNEWIWRSVVRGGAEEFKVVGCGRDWVAVFNKRSNELFLSEYNSSAFTRLPSIRTLPLPDPGVNMSVSKVELSSSPKDDECRAMIMFGPTNTLAFCSPGRSNEWTPIGDLFFESEDGQYDERYVRVHEDLVYCSRRKVFTTITAATLDPLHFEFDYVNEELAAERTDWDIQDPSSPRIKFRSRMPYWEKPVGKTANWGKENHELLKNECVQIPQLVYAEKSDQLFLAIRFVRLMKMDGSGLGDKKEGGWLKSAFLGKTYGFIVMEFTKEIIGYPMEVVEDLDGMAIVAGNNHSVAINVDPHHQQIKFEPNSIYFNIIQSAWSVANDTGVFSYATKTMYPYDGSPTLAMAINMY